MADKKVKETLEERFNALMAEKPCRECDEMKHDCNGCVFVSEYKFKQRPPEKRDRN
jgi:hypothetical protein